MTDLVKEGNFGKLKWKANFPRTGNGLRDQWNFISLHQRGYSLHQRGYSLHQRGYSLHQRGYSLHVLPTITNNIQFTPGGGNVMCVRISVFVQSKRVHLLIVYLKISLIYM